MDDQPAQAGAALPRRAGRAEQDRALGQREVGGWRNDHGIVAAQLEQTPPEPRRDLWPKLAAHAGRSGRGDQRDARIVGQRRADLATALQQLQQTVGRVAEASEGADGDRHRRCSGQRGLFARLPDHRIAAHQRQRRIPRPHRDRKVERADDGDRPERMPLFDHPVIGPLAGDGQPVQLARQADGIVANVDHFLHFALAFGDDLAGFERHQPGQRLLCDAQFLAEQADQFATPRGWHAAPRQKGGLRTRAGGGDVAGAGFHDRADAVAVDRRMAGERAASCDAQLAQQRGGFFRGAHWANSFAFAIAATPASIVSSRLAKHSRTRCLG